MSEQNMSLVAPTLADEETEFLLELHRFETGVKAGLRELNDALQHHDVESGIRAARRFMSLGVLMGEAQKKVVGL